MAVAILFFFTHYSILFYSILFFFTLYSILFYSLFYSGHIHHQKAVPILRQADAAPKGLFEQIRLFLDGNDAKFTALEKKIQTINTELKNKDKNLQDQISSLSSS